MSFWHRLNTNRDLFFILLIYLSIATAHSLVVPLTTGNDEWAHFLYLRFITENGRLPATSAERNQAGYKSDAPPLYHLLVAGATAGVEPARLLRPLDSPRRQLADNRPDPYALVHIGYERPPYRGEVLVWHIGRTVSIFFGAVLVTLTYLTSLELFANRFQARLAAAFVAFLPAVIFHSSVLSYESLSAVLTALFLWVGIRAVKKPRQWGWWLALGLLAGLAIITKYSAVLLPLEIVLIAWLAITGFPPKVTLPGMPAIQANSIAGPILKCLLMAGLALMLAVSGWFGWVVWRFNTIETQGPVVGILQPLLVGDASDTTSVQVAAFLFGRQDARTPLPRDYMQLMGLLLDSFWAAPVAGQFILSPFLSLLATLAALLSLVGLGWTWQKAGLADRRWIILLSFHALLIVPLLGIRVFTSFDPRETVQGRHLLLPAASAIAILLVLGWRGWPYKIGQIAVAGLLLWSVLGQVGWAALTYPLPMPVWPGHAPVAEQPPSQPSGETFAGSLQLTRVSWAELPGSPSLEVELWWQALATMTEDYLVELRLLDPAGRLVSYSLAHPVQGRYPTRAWEPGDVIKDTHWLPLINLPPGIYNLHLRLLDYQAQALPEDKSLSLGTVNLTQPAYPALNPCQVWFQGRPDSGGLWARTYPLRSTLTVIGLNRPTLTALNGETHQADLHPLVSVDNFHLFIVGPDWARSYQLRQDSTVCGDLAISVPSRSFIPPEIPHPLEANFNGEITLLGYDLPTRRIQPGQRLPLTLYWQALAYMGEDYQVFDNLLDSELRRWGGYDRRPRDGYSTLLWAPGEVITDSFGVPVDPAAPPGVYLLDLGLYRQTETGAASLPLLEAGQPTGRNSIQLGPIKVGGPPPEVVTARPASQIKLNQTLGDQITLLGYSLDQTSIVNCQLSIDNCQLTITLYWQAEMIPAADYTTFLHLRNTANETVAQKDSPPAGGRYPTSLWDKGEIIVDQISLPLAGVSPGRYTLVVGLYNLATAERLLVPGHPANEIDLETIEIP